MEPPSNHQQLKHPRRKPKTKCITSETFYANCKLVPIRGFNGKYKLDISKIEEQELLILPPEEKDSRLFGWKVEIRQRTNGKHHDKFYSHIQNGTKCRSTPEVINYILHGKQKNENAKKSGRAPKKNRSEEDEANTDSHPAENEKESGGSPSPRGLLQLQQLDRTSFCVDLNEAVKNEWAGLITSLGGNNGKGISIHEEPAGGLQSNKVSSGNLSVEGKGKGILIEEENDVERRSAFGIHSGMFSSQPYTYANFQNPTIMQGGWSMEGDGRMCISLDMAMNGIGSSNNPNHLIANLQNGNQVPAPHGVCTNTLPHNTIHDPCKTSSETNGQTLSANIVDAKNGEKDPLNSIHMDNGSLFDVVMPSEAEMDELMSFIYSDLEEEKQEIEEEEVDAVQDNETDLAKTYDDIIDDEPIVNSFYDKYWRDKLVP